MSGRGGGLALPARPVNVARGGRRADSHRKCNGGKEQKDIAAGLRNATGAQDYRNVCYNYPTSGVGAALSRGVPVT